LTRSFIGHDRTKENDGKQEDKSRRRCELVMLLYRSISVVILLHPNSAVRSMIALTGCPAFCITPSLIAENICSIPSNPHFDPLPLASASLISRTKTLIEPSAISSFPSSKPGLTPMASALPSELHARLLTLAG